MKHAREDYNVIQAPPELIPEDEPVFLLRGQDKFAPAVVGFWANLAGEHMGASKDIVIAAREQAERIREWQKTHKVKLPDLPVRS